MKKVLIVSNSSGLVTLFLKNDVELLKENGFQIDVACNTKYPDSNTDQFFEKYCNKVFDISFPIRNLDLKEILKSYITLKEIIKKGNYSLVHCHSTIAAVLARQCAKKYRKKGLKVIYTSHGFPFYDGNNGKKARLFKKIEKFYSEYTDGILTICNEDYQNASKMNCDIVKMMHGVGVDVTRFTNSHVERNEYRKKLGFDVTDKVILSIGELNTNKNHQIVIKAISKIKDVSILYAICGREVTEKGKKEELQNLANQLNVRISFLGFRKDIPEICQCADIGALPSFKEGLGLSGIEMLASGIPVVGASRQGIKDYVIDGETGYLANPESEDSFADAIKKCFGLIKKSETKQRCIIKAKEFNTCQSREVIDSIYREVGVY